MITAINPSQLWKKRLGDWVINPYIGCEHGCYHCYCPAMPGVKFANHGRTQREWGAYLYAKPGLIEALRDQLRNFTPKRAKRTEWGDGWILLSFLTDCYTPSEAKHKLTRQCLQLILEAGHKVRIQTRSALVERDFDILLDHRDRVILGTSLPYMDDRLARALEPRASSPTRRLKFLTRAADAGIPVYVAVAPFMPFHGSAIMEEVLAAVMPLSPREIFCEVLNPKGDNVNMMVEALRPNFSEQADLLAEYSGEHWAKFTWEVLAYGLERSPQFIPWPDTRRMWRKHLTTTGVNFLERFLPDRELAA